MRQDRPRLATRIGTALIVAAAILQGGPVIGPAAAQEASPHFAIPLSLLEEYADLHTSLEQAMRVGGQTGAAARRLMPLLDRHFGKEQRDAFPLLRLLPPASTGRFEPWMTELLPLADRLRAEMPLLLEEHRAMTIATSQLADAAWAENAPRVVDLAQRLRRQSRLEEQVLYPAALLVADCIRERTSRGSL